MPPNQEARQAGQSTNQAQSVRRENPREIQDQLLEEIRQVVNDEIQRNRLAKRLKDSVTDENATAQGLRSIEAGEAGAVQIEQAQSVYKNLVRVLKGVEEGIVQVPNEANKAVLLNLNQKIGTQINTDTASYIHPLVSKLLEAPQSTDDLKHSFDEIKTALAPYSSYLVTEISNSIVEAADRGSLSVGGDEARTMFNPEVTAQEQLQQASGRRGTTEMGSFGEDWSQYYRHFLSEEHKPVVAALYSTERLSDLVQSTRATIEAKATEEGVTLTEQQLGRKLSEEIELKIVLAYSNLFSRVDRQKADKTMEEIMQEGGIWNSINAVEAQFKNQLRLMSENIRRSSELPEGLRGLKFYQRYSLEPVSEKEVPIDPAHPERTKKMVQYKVIPIPGVEGGVSLADFLTNISTEVDHELSIRSYLHNVQSLFLRQPGEAGFWGQLGNYSEQINGDDLDSMMLLPDSDKFISAYRLYVKYLEEEFAKVNWIHQPNMFSSDYFKNDTKVQQRVFEDLKRMFPELGRADSESWRLRRAMSMGIGLAKGVLLTEAEIAAWADPHIYDDKGTPRFTSFYTNDAAAVQPLNPMHFFFRWQAEGVTKGPLIYLPVANLDKKMMRRWDHTVLWEKMKQYRQSFMKGRIDFKRMGDERLFADILPNYGKGGGFFTRGGWRVNHAMEGWRSFDAHGKEDIVKSFKALENIGYEVVRGLEVISKVDPNQQKELFNYLYAKYINPTGGNANDYIKTQLGGDKKLFMSTVYSRMIHQRMPTKFVRIERDRHSENGEALWKLVRKEVDPNISALDFDSTIKDLGFVEAKVRNEVSEEMRNYLDGLPDDQKDLAGFVPSREYKVDEDAIRRHLAHLSADKQELAVKVFNSINTVIERSNFLDGVAKNLNDPAVYPFSIASDEVDMTFLAMRNSGGRVLARTIKDTAQIETIVTKNMMEYLNKLHPVSISGKRDTHEMVQHLLKMKETLEGIHGHTIATRVAHHMAALTIAYFKKDAAAKNIFTKPFALKRPNSLAAEFAGTWRDVWEWEVADVDKFITELERERILPKNDKSDLSYQTDADGPKIWKRTILGIPYARMKHTEHGETTSAQDLRKNFGATKLDIAQEIVTKYLPIALVLLIYTLMSKANKENEGKRH